MNRTLSEWGAYAGGLPRPDSHRLGNKIDLANRRGECGKVQEPRKTVRFEH